MTSIYAFPIHDFSDLLVVRCVFVNSIAIQIVVHSFLPNLVTSCSCVLDADIDFNVEMPLLCTKMG